MLNAHGIAWHFGVKSILLDCLKEAIVLIKHLILRAEIHKDAWQHVQIRSGNNSR